MPNILLTGGQGFIGGRLLKKLLTGYRKYYNISDIDNLSSISRLSLDNGSPEVLTNNGYVFYEQDIRDINAVSKIIRRESIDTCVHMAAKTSIPESMDDPFTTIDVNVGGTLNMLEACSRNGVPNFIFLSSAAVYGDASKLPVLETHGFWPTSPYAFSKMTGEMLVSTYRKFKKIKNALSLRLFNVYDPGQSATDKGVISKFARDLLCGQSPTILGDGNQTRDFISVNDAVDSIILAADALQGQDCITNINAYPIRNNKMRLHTFNVGTGIPTTINDLAAKMISISGVDLRPVYKVEMNPEMIHYSYADTRRCHKYLKFEAVGLLEPNLRHILRSSKP